MAVLALGLAGAGIGSAIGGAFLGVSAASWGWTLGAYVGGQMTRTKLPTVYGPRLNDLSVQSSAYGNMIPIPFGRVRVAGNLIWSSGRVEHTRVTEVSQGGKGGGGFLAVLLAAFFGLRFGFPRHAIRPLAQPLDQIIAHSQPPPARAGFPVSVCAPPLPQAAPPSCAPHTNADTARPRL